MDTISVATNVKIDVKSNVRISAIDRFRGLAVFCMIFFQLIANFACFGILTKISSHNITIGIVILQSTTIADLIAPMFMFAIALTYKMSFEKRLSIHGRVATNIHFVLRYLGLIGLGAILYTINVIIDHASDFSTLRPIDYYFIAGTLLAVLLIIIVGAFSIPLLKKHRKIISMILTYVVALLGLLTIGVGLYDFIKITMLGDAYPRLSYWMVLQSLGFAGLLVLPLINLNLLTRSIVGLVLAVLYTIYYRYVNGQYVVNAITQGGFIGGLGWAMLITIGSVFMELFARSKKGAYFLTLGLTSLAVIMYFLLPINKSGVRPDPTYLVITLALSCIAFIVFDLFSFIKWKFDPLSWWGRYPILLYLFEFAIIGLFVQLAPDSIVKDAPLWLAILIVSIFIIGFTVVVFFLNKKNRKVSI
ncbi:MAG: hypothetical protein EOM77_03120 [Bacteroidia bacterium]|nr:hypothetical protein [Bacteroidia bacterium]